VFTAHLGDVVENAQASEFAQADPVFTILDRARMPYSVLAGNHASLFNDKISSLSPVSQADVALDESLRADMGAPDVRYVVVVSAGSQEAVLQTAERVSGVLQAQVERGQIAGFDSPSRYLPSLAAQSARQASLPPPEQLQPRLARAVQGLPVRAEIFAPFLADVAAARGRPPLQPADLEKTSMAMGLDALLLGKAGRWNALLPLTAPKGGNIQAADIRAALAAAALPGVLFVDLKTESDRLYAGYLHARATPSVKRNVATLLAVAGFAVMMVNLFVINFAVSGLHSYAGVG